MVFLLAAAKTFLAIKMEKIISLGQDIKKKRNNQKRPSIEYIILGILSDHLLGQIIFYSLYLDFFFCFSSSFFYLGSTKLFSPFWCLPSYKDSSYILQTWDQCKLTYITKRILTTTYKKPITVHDVGINQCVFTIMVLTYVNKVIYGSFFWRFTVSLT